jgi:hypothetical protein
MSGIDQITAATLQDERYSLKCKEDAAAFFGKLQISLDEGALAPARSRIAFCDIVAVAVSWAALVLVLVYPLLQVTAIFLYFGALLVRVLVRQLLPAFRHTRILPRLSASVSS